MEEKMYKAIEKIGKYQIGDEVPTEQAEVWMKMYKVSPVELVVSRTSAKPVEKESSKEFSSSPGVKKDISAKKSKFSRSK